MNTPGLICNAGVNAASVLPDGSVNTCYDRKDENIGNIFTGFRFREKLVECRKVHCSCPLWDFERALHKKAKGEPHEERPYQAFLHWHITYQCQMMCNYCIVTGPDRLTDTRDKLRQSPPVDIDAVMRTLDDTGMTYYLSMMGGEPAMVPNIVELCKVLTQKHYVGFNTNLAALDPRFWEEVNISHLGNFHISLHIQPMERRRLTERFIENFKAMNAAGFKNYYITAVGHPDMLARFHEYRDFFAKHDIFFKVIPMIEGGGATGGRIYPASYTKEELAIIQTDWLDNYFPQKNAANEKVHIEKFIPRNPNNKDHVMS